MSITYYFEPNNTYTDVLLKVREWDGVGKASHSIVDHIGLALAKGLFKQLSDAIDKVEAKEKENNTLRERQLEKEIEQKQVELAALRKKRETKFSPPPDDDDYTPI